MKTEVKTLTKIDSPHYNYFQAFFLSFYAKRLYIDVGLRWRGLGLLYLLLIISVISIPISVYFVLKANRYYDQELLTPIKMLPELVVQNGEVRFNKEMPYLIRDEKNKVIVIVDTTGKIKTITNDFPNLRILVTKHKIIYRVDSTDHVTNPASLLDTINVREQMFANTENALLSGDTLMELQQKNKFKLIIDVIVYPTVVAFTYMIFMSILLMMSILGRIFSRAVLKFNMPFKQSTRLMMVANTPVLMVYLFCLAFSINISSMPLFNVALLAAYYSYAVISLKHFSKQLVRL